MQEKRKRSKASIIIAVAAVVLLIVVMVVWRQYEAKHKDELEASVLTTDISQVPIEEEPEPATPKHVIPDDPDELLVMAEEALKDEGYFERIGRERGKGDHVHFLLKKCLDCEGDPGKVEGLVKRLKERSDEGYGPWRVDSADLTDLDDRIKAAKQL